MAIVASDSDFLIFEGDFEWWDANSIDMHHMTAKRFERKQLRQMLALSNEQLKYLATIAGNDYTKHAKLYRCDFKQVAKFCQSIDANQSEESIHRKIENYLQNNRAFKIDLCSIAKSIKSYDVNFDMEESIDPIDDYVKKNVLAFAFSKGKVFQYEANFLDFEERNTECQNNNIQLFLHSLLEVFCKLGGILLNQNSQDNPLLKIVTKYSLNENYKLREHAPIYPTSENTLDLVEFLLFFISIVNIL